MYYIFDLTTSTSNLRKLWWDPHWTWGIENFLIVVTVKSIAFTNLDLCITTKPTGRWVHRVWIVRGVLDGGYKMMANSNVASSTTQIWDKTQQNIYLRWNGVCLKTYYIGDNFPGERVFENQYSVKIICNYNFRSIASQARHVRYFRFTQKTEPRIYTKHNILNSLRR